MGSVWFFLFVHPLQKQCSLDYTQIHGFLSCSLIVTNIYCIGYRIIKTLWCFPLFYEQNSQHFHSGLFELSLGLSDAVFQSSAVNLEMLKVFKQIPSPIPVQWKNCDRFRKKCSFLWISMTSCSATNSTSNKTLTHNEQCLCSFSKALLFFLAI